MTSNPADVLIERLSNCFGYNCPSGETCNNHNETLILEARDEIERLRQELREIITFAETRRQDGIEMGATVWRIALEDIIKDAQKALKP